MTRDNSRSTEWLAKELNDLRKRTTNLEVKPNLAFSSIDNGSLTVTDEEGVVTAVIGLQEDGTYMAASINGPVPPTPSAPVLTDGTEVLTVRWDGRFDLEDTKAPMDFSAIEIHADRDPAFEVTPETLIGVITSSVGGSKTFAASIGEWYVKLVVKTLSGQHSIPSMETLGMSYAPEVADVREPSAPTALNATTALKFDEAGNHYADISATWVANPTATDDSEMEISHYELWGKEVSSPDWAVLTVGDTTSAVVKVRAGSSWSLKVRAISTTSTTPGAFSIEKAIVAPSDTTPPPVPTAPTVSTWLRTVTVRWAGTPAMPVDFSHINVYQNTVKVGEIGPLGFWQSGTMPAGVAISYTLASVDKAGNISAKSPAASVTPVANVDISLITDKLDAAKIAISNAGGIVVDGTKTLTTKLTEAFDGINEAKGDAVTLSDAAKQAAIDEAAQTAQTKADVVKVIADAALADAIKVRAEALSRGNDLVTNGSATMGTNTNFTGMKLVKGDQPTGTSGSFEVAGGSNWSIEKMTIDVNRKYAASVWARQTTPGVVSRFYLAIATYDADGLSIATSHYMEQANTRTTLAADLKPGDTTITLTSGANWKNNAGAATHLRRVLFWNYIDGSGKLWAPGTYTRNSINDAYADGGISGNIITLRTPYVGALVPAGTVVGNGSAGGNYMYPVGNALMTNEWTKFEGSFLMGGIHTDLTAAATDKFPLATATATIGVLPNYGVTGGTSLQRFAGFSFSDITANSKLVADAQAKADTASAAAIEADRLAKLAQTAAGVADGKANNALTMAGSATKAYYDTTVATGIARSDRDIWRQVDAQMNVIAEWYWDGTPPAGSWVKTMVSSETISNLDVGKLTVGSAVMSSAVIEHLWANVVTAKMVNAQAFIGENAILTGAITAPKITASEEMWAKVLGAHKINADEINTNSLTSDQAFIGNIWSAGLTIGVPSTNVTGTISNAQIASGIAGSKISGAVANATNATTATTASSASTAGSATTVTGSVGPSVNLPAGQLTSGTLKAGTTVSTNAGTAKVTIDPTGIKAFNAAGTRTVAINSDGSAEFTGKITMTDGTVPAANLSGTVASSQIAGVDASKVTGTLAASVPAANLTGTVANTQIAGVDGAKVTGTLAATVPTTKLSGTVTDAQIAGVSGTKVSGTVANATQATNATTANSATTAGSSTTVTGSVGAAVGLPVGQLKEGVLPADGTIKTGTGTSRVELSNTGLKAFQNGTQTVGINADGSAFFKGAIEIGSSVPTSVLSGTIGNSQIAGVDGSKVTGTVAGSVPAANLTGTVTSAQIAGVDGAKVTGTLAATVPTGNLSGTVTNAQIATGVDAAKLTGTVAATVPAGKVSGALVDANIPVLTEAKIPTLAESKVSGLTTKLDAASATTGTVNSWKMTGKTTINGGIIETDSISATQISATAITAAHLAGKTMTAGLVQSEATANRGVKFTSGGITAYDLVGNPTVVINADGSASFKGSVTVGSSVPASVVSGALATSNIPALDATKITSGTLPAAVQVADANIATGIAPSKLTGTGTIPTAAVPALDATKITTGTLPTGVKVSDGSINTGISPSKLTGTGTVPTAGIPALDATKITTGTLPTAVKIADGSLNTGISPSKLTGTGTIPLAGVPTLPTNKITGLDGKIADVDAAKLLLNDWSFTGTTEIDGGNIRADTITGTQVAANSIAANKLLVTGANLLPDPNFISIQSLNAIAAASTGVAVAVNAGGDMVVTPPTTTQAYLRPYGVEQSVGSYKEWIPVGPGEEYFFEAIVTYAGTGDIRLTFRSADGSTLIQPIYPSYSPGAWPTFTSGVRHTLSVKVPAGAYWALPEVRVAGSATPAIIRKGSLSLIKKSSGELIVDGSIKTKNLLVGGGPDLAINGSGELGTNLGYESYIRQSTNVPVGFEAAYSTPASASTLNFHTGANVIPMKPNTSYAVRVWVKANKAGSITYLEAMAGDPTKPRYIFTKVAVPTVWTPWQGTFTTGATVSSAYFRWFNNHSAGTARDTVFSFTGFSVQEMATGSLIVDGDIDGKIINGAVINGSEFNYVGDGSGLGYDMHITKDSKGSVINFEVPNSVLPSQIRASYEGMLTGWTNNKGPGLAFTTGTSADYDTRSHMRLSSGGFSWKDGIPYTILISESPGLKLSNGISFTTDSGSLAFSAIGALDSYDAMRLESYDAGALLKGYGEVTVNGYSNISGAMYAARLYDDSYGESAGLMDSGTASFFRNTSLATFTTSNAGNVYANTQGSLYRSTSAQKYKLAIEEMDGFEDALLSLKAKSWFDKLESERVADMIEAEDQGEVFEDDNMPHALRRIPGMIAEEVEAAGLSEFVTYGNDGQVEGLMYDRLGVALIPVVARQRDRIEELESKVSDQEARLLDLEAKMATLYTA